MRARAVPDALLCLPACLPCRACAACALSSGRFAAPEAWLSAFYAASSAAMAQLEPVGISQLSYGLVTLAAGLPPPAPWIESLLEAAQPQLASMELLQLCNLGWALGSWGHRPPAPAFGAFLDASEPLLAAATPTDLCTLLWACNRCAHASRRVRMRVRGCDGHAWLA